MAQTTLDIRSECETSGERGGPRWARQSPSEITPGWCCQSPHGPRRGGAERAIAAVVGTAHGAQSWAAQGIPASQPAFYNNATIAGGPAAVYA
ncbi:MAG TPA: hypothetical protein VHF24_06165 [Acidimicrobiales bacterium]|nr:hypothetical protein [Acidimicrobiales bacterium]